MKHAVVTGASEGIGAATAKALVGDGWFVTLAARNEGKLTALAVELGDRAEVVVTDVTDEASVNNLAAHVGTIDLLVNNAGGARGLDPIESADLEDWQWMFETNVLGTVRVTKALLPQMAADGLIVNLGSVAGITPYWGGAGYNAAKFSVAALTRVLRLEFEKAGRRIRVTEINPGRVKTDFSLHRFKGDRAQADAVYADKLNLTPEDIAEAIRWVAAQPAHVNIDRMVVRPVDQT
ncbi:MAG: SDR family oxidoreductase [Corynebacterium sp.]|nr:SDR family oxidoreductase [Corynebacterium sp.]